MPVASCTRASFRGFLRRCAILVGLRLLYEGERAPRELFLISLIAQSS